MLSAWQLIALVIAAAALSGCGGNAPYLETEGSFNYSLLFCSIDDCLGEVASRLADAQSFVQCAFYRADSGLLENVSVTAEIVLDDKAKIPGHGSVSVTEARSQGIMHSKYCVIDNRTVLTGSFNPTTRARSDYNNLLVINSTVLASFYRSNFESLKARGKAKSGVTAAAVGTGRRNMAVLNGTAVSVYFCPGDDCVEAVKREIAAARKSIIFASYSFTHPEIANELILKAASNITVEGVMEKSGTGSKYSKYSSMIANGISIRLESSKRLMHHKFFVIDNETVMTGSFNPTQNAAERNDENLIIIRNREVAVEYNEEFNRIYGGEDVQE